MSHNTEHLIWGSRDISNSIAAHLWHRAEVLANTFSALQLPNVLVYGIQ